VDLHTFLAADQECSTRQAAFRLAYELPCVARVAVGTSNPAHLRELVSDQLDLIGTPHHLLVGIVPAQRRIYHGRSAVWYV